MFSPHLKSSELFDAKRYESICVGNAVPAKLLLRHSAIYDSLKKGHCLLLIFPIPFFLDCRAFLEIINCILVIWENEVHFQTQLAVDVIT